MDFSDFPTIGTAPQLPRYAPDPPPPPPPNALWGGIRSGTVQAAGDFSSMVGAAAQALGAKDASANANAWANYLNSRAQALGRPDLEAQPWFGAGSGGIGGFLTKGVYELGKMAPVLGAAVGAGALAPAVAVPDSVAALGAAMPRILGGAGAALGTAGAEDLATGAALARNIGAAGAVMYPSAVAGQYEQAQKVPGGATTADAAKALLFGAPLAAIQGVVPGGQAGLLARGSEGTILRRVAGAGMANAAAGAVAGGINTAADLSYRPDISGVAKAKQIVAATLQSGAMGGVVGGMFGALGGSHNNPNMSNADLSATVDEALQLPPPNGPAWATHYNTTLALPGPADFNRPPIRNPVITPESFAPTTIEGIPVSPRDNAILALPGPADFNRPPIRNPVITPERFAPTTIEGIPINPLELTGEPPVEPVTARAEPTPVDRLTATNEAAQINDMRAATLAAAGNSRAKDVANFVKTSQAATRPELYNEYQTALDAADEKGGSLSQGMRTIGQELGILDSTGKERDLDADLVQAQQQAQSIWDDPRAKTNPGFARKAQDIQSKIIPQIQDWIALRDQAAALRAPKEALGETPESAPPAPEVAQPPVEPAVSSAAPPMAEPVSVADRVMSAARGIAGAAGGNVPVDAIRRALPDVAKPDLDNALRQINADDTGSELVKAPVGQRSGRDGVTVGDGGKFHMLSVEPQTVRTIEPTNSLARPPASWVLRDKVTGKPVMETFDPATAAAVNTTKYEAVPILQHLQEYNAAVRANGGSEPAQIKPTPEAVTPPGTASQASVGAMQDELPPPSSDPVMDSLSPTEGSVHTTPEAVAQDYLAQRQAGASTEEPSPNGELPSQPSLFKAADSVPTRRAVLSPEVTAAHVAKFTSQLRPDLQSRVHVVNDPSELPPQVLQDAARSGLNVHELQAAYSGGDAYLLSSQMHSKADVEAALSHEVFGHLGTSERLGPIGSMGYESRIAGIFDRAGGVDGVMKLAKRFGVEKDVGYYVPHEAFTLAPDDKARLVEELIAHAAEAPQGRLRTALMTMVAKLRAGFAETLRALGLSSFARRFETFGPAEMTKWLGETRQALGAGGTSFTQQRNLAGAATSFAKRIPAQNRDMGTIARATTSIMDEIPSLAKARKTLDLRGMKRALKSGTLGWDGFSSLTDMARAFQHELPGIRQLLELEKTVQNGLSARFSQLHGNTVQALYEFGQANPKLGGVLQHMMQMSAQFNLDARRPWEAHTWLHDDPRAAQLKEAHDELRANWNKLGQTPGSIGQKLYQNAVNIGRVDAYASMGLLLHRAVKMFHPDEGIAGFGNDFARDFLFNHDELHGDPNAAAQFFRNELTQRIEGAQEWLNAQEAITDPAKRAVAMENAGALSDLLRTVSRNLNRMQQAPYFHLGRFGDKFISMHIRKLADGSVDPEAFAKIQQAMEANEFGDVALHPLSDQAHVFMRFKNADGHDAMYRLALKFKRDGLLDPGEDLIRGAVDHEDFYKDIAPSFLQKMVETARAQGQASGLPAEALDNFIDQVRGIALDMLPDNSMQKVLQKRVGVQGFNPNMFQNMAHRGAVSAAAISRMATMQERNAIFANLRQSVKNAELDPDKDPIRLGDIVNEVMKRSINKDVRVGQSFLDYANSFIHSFYIGASPAYALLQVSQIPTLGIPQLAKRYGFANSFAAVAKAAPKAFDLMRAIAATNTGHRADAAITPEVLARTKMTKDEREFMRMLVNRSDIELGGFTRALSDIAANRGQISGTYSKALHWANASAVYSETFARTIMALAAHDLHVGSKSDTGLASRVAYGSRILADSMFNWGSYDTPRQFSKGGALGGFGPIVGKFHQFTSKLVNLLVHEIGAALPGSDATAAERQEARTFMKWHTAAVITLAGTLGLPAAGWFAGAATRLSGLANGGEGYDVEAHYHEFLSNMFGKDAAEMITRGLPRYLGVDLSDWGDAEIAPFTRLMEDRREFEDAWTSYLAHAWGAPLSTVANWVVGSRDIANGRPLEGMARMLPVAMRNVVDSYRLSDEGYIDKAGRQMPLPHGAAEIIKKALGLDSGQFEEYEEKTHAITGLREERSYRAGIINQNIARAYSRGDAAGAQKWLAEARKFDADPDHINDMILPRLGQYLMQWQRAQAMGRAIGVMGVNPRDPAEMAVNNAY